jgi:hypothetical protein
MGQYQEKLQRQLYNNRCELFLHTAAELKRIFEGRECRRFEIQKISRAVFVAVSAA